MPSKIQMLYIIPVISIFVFAGLLAGCVSVYNPYVGKTVSETNIIPLQQGGPHEGNWETKQVGFKYRYNHSGNILNLSGELFCYIATHWTYEIVDSLVFRISFIDSEGKLIESRIFWSLVTDRHFYQWQIKEQKLVLPPNTVAVGFSYSGSVRDGGGTTPNANGEGTQIDLWYSPLGEQIPAE